MIPFCSLHNQTDLSILDSLISVKELFDRAIELGQSSIAITDHGTLGSAWEAWKVSKETGIKLIIGCECYFQNQINSEDKLRHIVLLAKNAVGYKNLLTINKRGFDRSSSIGKRVYSVIDWELLEQYSEGLICLTACGNGIISQLLMNKKFDEAEKTLLKLKDVFKDNLGIEVQPNNMKRFANAYNDEIDQQFLNRALINLGAKHNIKVVAACNSHYLKKEDHDIHDMLLTIGSHQDIYSNFRLKYPAPEFYLKSGDEVKAFFSRNYGEECAEQLCANSIYFSDLCEVPEWIDPKFSNPSGKELPIFPVKDEIDYNEFCEWLNFQSEEDKKLPEDANYLKYKCFQEFKNIKLTLSEEQIPRYIERINEELDTFNYHGFSSYMLIVADYVSWARKNSIPTGSGRGSVGGSIIGYLLNIHKADPIKYDLIFERFQNKEKKSFPDIDQDISTAGRDKVLKYIISKYGTDNVASISNFNKITPKVYLRDVSRSMQFGGTKEIATENGNNLAGTIPKEMVSTLNMDKLLEIPLFSEYCKKFPEIIKYKKILGKPRSLSMHAAAIVIGQRSLVGLVPLRKDKDDIQIVEYDKDVAEANGLVKMDLLGLSTLDLIDNTIKFINSNNNITLGVDDINVHEYDEKTYNLISSGDTYGVFQFGTSAGTIDLCKRIKPKSIEDLAIITTLARPAARDIRDDFIKTREGKKEFSLLDESLKGAFAKTFGFGLFDESILQLGRDVAGWSLNDADRIRKMIKEKGKAPEKAKKLREEFIVGAIKNGISEIIAPRIWDEEIAKFAGYTFNKSLSFSESVDIYTSDGKFLETKSICKVCSGDYVRSCCEKSKKDIFIKVLNIHDHGILPLVEVELTTGEKVKCTLDHKFRANNGEMISLKYLINSDLFIVVNSSAKQIKSVRKIEDQQTYDLEVDHPDHQYYLSNGMLTSNSHAVMYSFISYITAYLKAHYPIEFLLVNLMTEVKSNTPDAKGNIEKIKSELRAHKIKILPPSINTSELTYTLLPKEKKLLTGLDALKFVGDEAILDIIEKRPFKDFADFMARVDSRTVRANSIQALAASGALDSFNIPRHQIFLYVSDYRKKLQVWLKKHDPSVETFIYPWAIEPDWTTAEIYALEHFYLGESFICKPPEAYGSFFKDDHQTLSFVKKSKDRTNIQSVKAIVRDLFEFKVKKEGSKYFGQPMVKVLLEDKNGDQCGCTIFPDRWKMVQERIKEIHSKAKFEVGLALHFSGSANSYEDETGIILDKLYNISLPPSTPKDLKPKKVSMKASKSKITESSEINKESLFEEIEDSLINEGLLDLEFESEEI